MTAQLSASPLTGVGFNPATGGSSCGNTTDFVQLTNAPFTIPANTTTTTITITVCGDTAIEPNEQIFVALTNVVGAQCLEGTCSAVGTIRSDDGPPSIAINNIAPTEPLSGTLTTSFTVSLSHPSQSPVSVSFATRAGTAIGAGSCAQFITGGFPDYVSRSGTLSIPAATLSGTIGVTICADKVSDANQTFFVDLSNPLNATIADGVGQATIREASLTVGEFDLTPDEARLRAGERMTSTVVWTVPEGRVWRDLNTIDLRVRSGQRTALWVRWDEPSNAFSLCQHTDDNAEDDSDAEGDGGDAANVRCGPGALPGSPTVLTTSLGRLHLADTTVLGSGPTGTSVTLRLSISFAERAAGRYLVELAAADDFGNQDPFVSGGTLHIEPAGRD